MRSILLAAMTLGMIGCVGELDMPSGGGGAEVCGDSIDNNGNGQVDEGCTPTGGDDAAVARQMFNQNVYPILKADCVACHNATGPVGNVTGFVNTDASQAYDTAVGYVALVGNFAASSAPILLKVEAGHNGITYTSDQTAAITAWLDKEITARGAGSGGGSGSGGGTESPSQVTQRLLEEWSGCMTIENFNTAQMAQKWGTMTATNNQKCMNCHVNGAEGFIASTDADAMFGLISSNKYYMLQYFSADLTNLAQAKIIVNTASFLGVSQGKDPHREHPRFNALQNQGMDALQQFYDLTATAKANAPGGVCGPSKLTN